MRWSWRWVTVLLMLSLALGAGGSNLTSRSWRAGSQQLGPRGGPQQAVQVRGWPWTEQRRIPTDVGSGWEPMRAPDPQARWRNLLVWTLGWWLLLTLASTVVVAIWNRRSSAPESPKD